MSLQTLIEQVKKEYAKAAPEERDEAIRVVADLGKNDLTERHKGRLLNLQNDYRQLCSEIDTLQKQRKKNRRNYNSLKSQMRSRAQALKDKEGFFESEDEELVEEYLESEKKMAKLLKP